MAELKDLQGQLESLKHLMERFFMGAEKRLPGRQRSEVTRAIRRFVPGNDAVERFKHQNLIQRLMTLERYWDRTLKAIEEGRYHRDVFKADFRNATRRSAPESRAATNNSKGQDDSVASAFLESLGASPKVSIRGQPKNDGEGAHSSVQSAPKIELRGRTRKRKED